MTILLNPVTLKVKLETGRHVKYVAHQHYIFQQSLLLKECISGVTENC